MPGKKQEAGFAAAVEEKPIVIVIGKKKCPPKRKSGFKTEAAALAWARGTHCTGRCKDAGLMVIGGDGEYEAIRFCK